MKRTRVSSLESETDALTLNEFCSTTTKYAALECSRQLTPVIRCSLPPHEPRDFPDIASYEIHYMSNHTHCCSECHCNLPSARFLDLHITELHDPLSAVQRDAGQKTYACFVEGCDKVCISWVKRRSHLIDKHNFPRNYDFFVVRDGIDGRRSLLRPGIDDQGHRRSSRERQEANGTAAAESVASRTESNVALRRAQQEDQTFELRRTAVTDTQVSSMSENEVEATDGAMEAVVSTFGSLRMVPRSVKFGRRKGRAGFAKA